MNYNNEFPEVRREHYLPYGKQWVDEEDVQAVVDVLRSDYLTTGPKVKQFEEEFADYVDAAYAVSFSNGTDALHAACFAAGIDVGDEVITTPMTFAASANCILYQGAKPVFADIKEDTYNLDPYQVKKKITKKTKAIIPVDFTGQPAELEAINRIAKENALVVIEDGAHAVGALYQDKKVGALSDMTMFSFHPVKHITTGEGGMITTNNRDYYELLLQFRSHGITREPAKLERNEGPWYYEMQFLGRNSRMTDIQAALGASQLKKADQFIQRRKEIVASYNKAFAKIAPVTIPHQRSEGESSWHLYIIRLDLSMLTVGRGEIFQILQEKNIGVNVHYIPVHYHPYYEKLGYGEERYPKAEALYDEMLSLPLFPSMNEQDVLDVINAIEKVVQQYSR